MQTARQSRRKLRPVFLVLALIASVFGVSTASLLANPSPASAAVAYYLPYPAGATYNVTQGPLACAPSHCAGGNSAYAYDFSLGEDDPIAASAPGTLYRRENNASLGNVVFIRHADGDCTLYAHMENFSSAISGMAIGGSVAQAQILGTAGETGDAQGVHLHFGKTNACGWATEPIDFVESNWTSENGAGTTGGTTPVYKNYARNGGFNEGSAHWAIRNGANFVTYTGSSYEGARYGATNTATAGGGIYNDYPRTINAGDVFCVDAMIRTAGGGTGASGTLALWLMGGSGNVSNTYAFSAVGPSWQPVSTCVDATDDHSQLRVQFYPTPGGPTLEVDAVDMHLATARNPGFERGSADWGVRNGANFVVYSGSGYDGDKFGATNAAASGDSIFNDRTMTINDGDSVCAEAQVRTAGGGTGATGTFALWLMGGNSNESGSIATGALPADWKPVKTCVTATTAHSKVRVQFYPTPGGSTVDIDNVDAHRTPLDNGNFSAGASQWTVRSGGNFAVYSTDAYEGSHRGATNAVASGGGIVQDMAVSTVDNDTFCAEAMVKGSGAQGTMALWLLGGSGNENSSINVGTLTDDWKLVKTCVTATGSHSAVRVQFYPTVGAPTMSIDAVDVH